MLFCSRNADGGSLLIEVIMAVGVLAAGLLMVMQSFAVQGRTARMNEAYTRDIFALADQLGASLAGVDGRQLYGKDHSLARGHIKFFEKECSDEKEGLKEMTFHVASDRSRQQRMRFSTYARVENAPALF